MAVIRDYLITQFTLYGVSLLKKQFDDIALGYEKGMSSKIKSTRENAFKALDDASKKQRQTIHQEYSDRRKVLSDQIKDVKRDYFVGFINQAEARRRVQAIKDDLDMNEKIKQNKMNVLKRAVSEEKKLVNEKIDEEFKKKFDNVKKITNAGYVAAATLTSIFFAVGRSIYTVIENIQQALRLSIDFGENLQKSFGTARAFSLLGLNASIMSSAVNKLSSALVAQKHTGGYMMSWMGMSPYELFNLSPEQAINKILTGLQKIPDISKRNYIGNQLLGDNWKDLMIAKELGAFDLGSEINSQYTESYLKKVIEVNKQWAEMKAHVQDLGISVFRSLMPVLDKIGKLIKYFAENQHVFWLMIAALSSLSIGLGSLTGNVFAIGGGVAGLTTSIFGLIGASQTSEEIQTGILSETRRQTTLMDMTYRSINSLRMDLNAYLATTARRGSDMYQASIYRALLTNTGGL